MFEGRSTEDLMRIATCGGGFCLNAGGRATEDLMRIATAASGKTARITFRGLSGRSTEDLMRIATAGKGCVEFVD
jgi:DNA replication protein